MRQLELNLIPSEGRSASVEASTYRFTRNALIEDLGQKRIVYGLWERLFGCWVIDPRTNRSREFVPTWRPLNQHGIWRDQLGLRARANNPCNYSSRWRYEANAAFAAYFSGIPQRMRALVASFGCYQWLALDMIWQHPEFARFLDEEIYNGTQQFTFACFALARPQHFSRKRRSEFALGLMRTKRTDLLTVLSGTTCSRSTLKTLCKLGSVPCRQDIYQAVIGCIPGGDIARALSHADAIYPSSIAALGKLPRAFQLPNVARIFLTEPDAARNLGGLMNERDGSALSNLVNIFPKAPHDLRERAAHSLTRARSFSEFLKWGVRWERRIVEVMSFPPPPIGGFGTLMPLTSPDAMRREGRDMRNCVGGMIHAVMEGEAYFYHWDGEEQATVMLFRDPDGDWSVADALGFDNVSLSDQTEINILSLVKWCIRNRVNHRGKGNTPETSDE